jgi:23S rRNA (cytidine1920-2'-O)/16S rRNA (cytidine1409-2'-O)-methyltransferase
MPRSRLDIALVERGLAPSRSRAQAAVLAGRVRVDGRVSDKPGLAVDDERIIEVAAAPEFVSRGGRKLSNALDAFGIEVAGARALDLGASTGGFTDCLLRRDAREVIALDVGYGQLDWRLRNDPRVHVMERTNARALAPGMLAYAPDLVVCDLAFISTALVWGAVAPCLAHDWRALLMVKPQFEAGRGQVGSSGVVRDPAVRAAAVRRVADAIMAVGGAVLGAADSGVPGPKGNREVFLLATASGAALPVPDLDQRIADAVAVGHPAETP